MTNTQNKINSIVEEYKEVFADEFNTFCNSMIDKKEVQKDELSKLSQDGILKQFAYEIPLTLSNMLDDMLDKEDKLYLKSVKGAEWFGRHFKEFSPAALI
jgi:hypothetical protein